MSHEHPARNYESSRSLAVRFRTIKAEDKNAVQALASHDASSQVSIEQICNTARTIKDKYKLFAQDFANSDVTREISTYRYKHNNILPSKRKTALIGDTLARLIEDVAVSDITNLFHTKFDNSDQKAIDEAYARFIRELRHADTPYTENSFEKRLLRHIGHPDKSYIYARRQFWNELKENEIFQEIFGESAQQQEEKLYEHMTQDVLSENPSKSSKAIEALAAYKPAPEALRNLLMFTHTDNTQLNCITRKTLSYFSQQDDWTDTLERAGQQYPELRKAIPQLERFNDIPQNEMQEALMPLAVATLNNPPDYSLENTRMLVMHASRFVPKEDLLAILLQKSISSQAPETDLAYSVLMKKYGYELGNALCKTVGEKRSIDKRFSRAFQDYLSGGFAEESPESFHEKFQILIKHVPDLFPLFSPEAPLYSNAQAIFTDIFLSDDPIKKGQEISAIFNKNIPYWKQIFWYTDSILGDQLSTAESKSPITSVPKIRTALGEKIDFSQDFSFVIRPIKQMTIYEKAHITNPNDTDYATLGDRNTLPFSHFRPDQKKLIFAYILSQVISTSRDKSAREASHHAHLSPENPLVLKGNMLIHGSAIEFLDSILQNGNLPGEAHGYHPETDRFPFHTDFSKISPSNEPEQTTEQAIQTSFAADYGLYGKYGKEGQIFYLYEYDDHKGIPTGNNHDHILILGGCPSTDISGIVLSSPEVTLDHTKKSLLEAGFYIPVYSKKGKLLYTPEEYQHSYDAYNYRVPVEIWDYALKTGEKLGSNPGAEFTVPTENGTIKYYVKFSSEDKPDHLWNEQLANSIYRYMGIPVPETKIVRIGELYGHASRIMKLDPTNISPDIKNGFIADCLLANWDIAGRANNVLTSEGMPIRVDNGGALLFRAKGERKKNFGATVNELESMRLHYSHLTKADITQQARSLQNHLTDTAIDDLVDNVRLSKDDRIYLKKTLKARRDTILHYTGIIR